MTLRKLPKYHLSEEKKYLTRCINSKVNLLINPYKPKLIPYVRNNYKTFWAFTSTSPKYHDSFKFLGKETPEGKKKNCGTIFSVYGSVWGYDITVFNYYLEEEILLEPERKFRIENVVPNIPDVNDIIYVTWKLEIHQSY